MKRIKLIAMLVALLCSSSLFAKEFDWSECWCNYGGGLKKGDVLVTADAGLWYSDLSYWGYSGAWVLPPVMVEVQYAQPIWKLPFTFGGYAGMRGYSWEVNGEKQTYMGLFFGGEAEYHIMLPPESLDVYAAARVGGGFPLVKPHEKYWIAEPSDFFHFGGSIGASWYFTKTAGLNLEFGYPLSKFGVTLKF